MNLVDYIIKRFDGEILVPNQWRVDGSKGNKYTVEWDEEKNDLEALTCPFCGYEVEQEDNDIPEDAEHESWN